MVTKIYARFALAVMMIMTIVSCDTTSEELENSACFDIVTFVAQTDKGSVFTFQQEKDSPVITLTSTETIDNSNIKVGDRVMLAYYPTSGQHYVSGAITPIYCMPIYTGNVWVGKSADYNNWQSSAVLMQALWRSGEYINIQCLAPVVNEPSKFDLIVDDATIDDEYPQVYLIFESDDETTTTTKTLYGSFNISSVWDKSDVKGIIINFSNYIGQNSVSLSKE